MDIRTLKARDLEDAAALLQQAFSHSAHTRGYKSPWTGDGEARDLLDRERQSRQGHVVVAEEGGAIVGVGCVRLRGEVATVGPVAAFPEGRGVGGAVLDELLRRADDEGASATRLYVDAWNPSAYALYAGRGFGVVDVVAHVDRPPGIAPGLANSRGLEVRAFSQSDIDELERFDRKLTGNERGGDLSAGVRLVARRRGDLVGYLGAKTTDSEVLLGPAVAMDMSDLFTLVMNALSGTAEWLDAALPLRARLSTAAPAATMAAMGTGFRVRELGVVLSRGAPPPTRPPQMYSIDPEIM